MDDQDKYRKIRTFDNLDTMIAISKDMQIALQGKYNSTKMHDLCIDVAKYIIDNFTAIEKLLKKDDNGTETKKNIKS